LYSACGSRMNCTLQWSAVVRSGPHLSARVRNNSQLFAVGRSLKCAALSDFRSVSFKDGSTYQIFVVGELRLPQPLSGVGGRIGEFVRALLTPRTYCGTTAELLRNYCGTTADLLRTAFAANPHPASRVQVRSSQLVSQPAASLRPALPLDRNTQRLVRTPQQLVCSPHLLAQKKRPHRTVGPFLYMGDPLRRSMRGVDGLVRNGAPNVSREYRRRLGLVSPRYDDPERLG